jgi:hypothetical protein
VGNSHFIITTHLVIGPIHWSLFIHDAISRRDNNYHSWGFAEGKKFKVKSKN